MFETVLITLTVLMVLITLAPFLPTNHWLSRVWEFPRVQITVLILALLLLSVFVGDVQLKIILILANSGVALYHIFWIFPYTQFAKRQVHNATDAKGKPSVKIMTSNVLMPNHSVHKLIDIVNLHQPDILVTLETNEWWENALAAIHCDYPHRIQRPLDNLYGMHLYSKYPLEDVQLIDLVEKDIPSIHCYLRLDNHVKVRCHFLHPAPPSPTENETSTPRDRELLMIARKVAQHNEPTIVTGDLNDVAWSPTTRAFRRISGLKDPRIGRGMFNTFHADYRFLRWPLDHIFHSAHFELGELKRMPTIDSDHFPLFSELIFVDKNKN
jgi:endonuclease/exonuclease/phosphatase (EEP) superfamily protein YafD